MHSIVTEQILMYEWRKQKYNNINGYFQVLFLRRAHSTFIKKIIIIKKINGVNIELGKTNRLKALCMMEIKNEINKLCNNNNGYF